MDDKPELKMKNIKIGELCLLILVGTVAVVLCTTIIGMAVSHAPTTEANAAIRSKLIDMIQMIAGACIGVVSTLLSANKDKGEDELK